MAKMICDRCEQTFYVRRSELDCTTIYCPCEELQRNMEYNLIQSTFILPSVHKQFGTTINITELCELEPWECRRIV